MKGMGYVMQNDFGSEAYFDKMVLLKYQPRSYKTLYLYNILNKVYFKEILPSIIRNTLSSVRTSFLHET
jgi:hypothetical protein